jgi:Holliday junction resolvasome RuvABC endonuclease subunit
MALSEEQREKIRKAKNAKLSKYNILALDVATNCGWATENGSGCWNLGIKRDESSGMRLLRFRSKLKEIIELEKINVVVFERSAGRHQNAVITQSELHGVLKIFCEDNMIPHRAFSASEIKKHATGKGNAGKPAMIKAAKDKLGYKGNDDNEADALWIYNLAKQELL